MQLFLKHRKVMNSTTFGQEAINSFQTNFYVRTEATKLHSRVSKYMGNMRHEARNLSHSN